MIGGKDKRPLHIDRQVTLSDVQKEMIREMFPGTPDNMLFKEEIKTSPIQNPNQKERR